MKATDLRIGNLVTVNNPEFWPQLKDVPLVVYSITPNRSIKNDEWSYSIGLISLNERDNITMPLYAQMIEYIEPIALSKEIFDHLDAIKDIHGDLFIFESIDRDIRFYLVNGFIQRTKGDYCPLSNYEHITSVHLFQNLYNISTGNELAFVDDVSTI